MKIKIKEVEGAQDTQHLYIQEMENPGLYKRLVNIILGKKI